MEQNRPSWEGPCCDRPNDGGCPLKYESRCILTTDHIQFTEYKLVCHIMWYHVRITSGDMNMCILHGSPVSLAFINQVER